MYSEIDELTRKDHFYLTPIDECYFEGEYTPREGFSYSDTNNFIHNLKKPVERRGRAEWRYKENAISRAAKSIKLGFEKDWIKSVVLIPSPPSKMPTDQAYDDRIIRILKQIEPQWNLDIRKLIVQTRNREAMHTLDDRYTPDQLMNMWEINEALINPIPSKIAFVDDILTSGTHFRAAKDLLQQRFGPLSVTGIFLARVVRPNIDIDISALFGLDVG